MKIAATNLPTPETDALSFRVGKNALHPDTVVVAVNDAKRFERERDEARQILASLKRIKVQLE
jgi:hypothetical protein